VVSPARRARQTWELSPAKLGLTAAPVLDERIYRNTVQNLLEIVQETSAEVSTLVIVGHNPGIQNLATALDDGRGDDAGLIDDQVPDWRCRRTRHQRRLDSGQIRNPDQLRRAALTAPTRSGSRAVPATRRTREATTGANQPPRTAERWSW
jgi:hypothetical protein